MRSPRRVAAAVITVVLVGVGALATAPAWSEGPNHTPYGPTAPALAASPSQPGMTASGDPGVAAWHNVFGASRNLRAVIGSAGTLQEDAVLRPLLQDVALGEPGVHRLAVSAPDGAPLVAVSLAPFRSNTRGRLQGYRVGRWPSGGLALTDPRYSAPAGYIPVTPANDSTPISKRFRLRDFLTHDQQAVWPKVLVLRPVLVDKLELIGDELERRGLPGRLHVMSGFRTPRYNALGVGRTGGRARESRHMYGDAADVFVDADGDGVMDDLDGDGRITVRDARVLFAVAEQVEARHPGLVGGLSAYRATSAHGPFVHVDVRGTRARW